MPLLSLPPRGSLRSERAYVVLVVLTALTALLAVRLTVGLGSERLEAFSDAWLYHGIMVAAAGLCLARGVLRRAGRRAPWTLLGMALAGWALGSVYWTFFLDAGALPAFSLADLLWLGFYPPVYAALVLLHWGRERHTLWVDGLIAALAVGAVGVAVVFEAVLEAVEGERLAIVTVNLAYPLADTVLLGLVAGALAASGWRVSRTWALLAGGVALFAVSDFVYVHQVAVGSYRVGAPVDLGWVAAAVVIAWAAWRPSRGSPPPLPAYGGAGVLLLPAVFALVALGVLVYDHFERVNPLALLLAAGALVTVILRLVLTFREKIALIAAARGEACTDALTGLGNRRRLLDDLEARLRQPRPTGALVMFDLDGFKQYNDTFGHGAGDALLARVGRSLARAAAARGSVYRLGGDEFCALLEVAPEEAPAVAAELAGAAAERGRGFKISASYGWVTLADEAATASAALRLADHRMYAQKRRGRSSLVHQMSSVLATTLAERSEYLAGHSRGVSMLAGATAAALGLAEDEREQVRLVATLHDVGKIAIPDTLLERAGPLDEEEERLVRGHTVVGERILRAAPALTAVAALVRATHERFDGLGYPDGLRGDEIPLAARIVLACDAYDAMVNGRPYAPRRDAAAAVAELERGAGTQFDPAVVEALASVVAGHAAVA